MTDPFDDLLDLEDEFYKEGYEAGIADATYAGMIEGKVFGIEKGYEKAVELARIHGRALVWNARLASAKIETGQEMTTSIDKQDRAWKLKPLEQARGEFEILSGNTRLQKHIENLLALTDSVQVSIENSDNAVTELDDRLAKARTKAKVIANIAGEAVSPSMNANAGIEDATGLNARH